MLKTRTWLPLLSKKNSHTSTKYKPSFNYQPTPTKLDNYILFPAHLHVKEFGEIYFLLLVLDWSLLSKIPASTELGRDYKF